MFFSGDRCYDLLLLISLRICGIKSMYVPSFLKPIKHKLNANSIYPVYACCNRYRLPNSHSLEKVDRFEVV